MIVGIGTDIASVARIEGILSKHESRFVARILTPAEVLRYESAAQPVSWLAKRFAAKEAAAKALGTGIAEGIGWQHFEIDNDERGAPRLLMSGPAQARADVLGVKSMHLSLSDEKEYAVAFVILES